MKLRQLKESLEDFDQDMEVVIRIDDPDDNLVEEGPDGSYLETGDERAVLVEYGRLVIVGDYMEPMED